MDGSPGDGSIYVRDNDLVIPVPQVDGSLTAARSLVLSGYTEHNLIRTVLQLQRHLREWDKKETDKTENETYDKKY